MEKLLPFFSILCSVTYFENVCVTVKANISRKAKSVFNLNTVCGQCTFLVFRKEK